MAKERVPLIYRIPIGQQLLIYTLLAVVGASMILPFLWMLATALKPKSQVDKPTWLPYREYVTVDGKEHEALFKRRVKTGVYRVQVTGCGERKGQIIEADTRYLTPFMYSEKRFSYSGGADGNILDVAFKGYVVPETYEVRYETSGAADSATGAPVSAVAQAPEDQIVRRISPRWENFPRCVDLAEVFGRSMLNSLFVSILVTLGQMITCSLAAFAFARLSFRGRDALFMCYLATLMIPGTVTMIPLFIILKAIPELLNWAFHTDFFGSALYLTYKGMYLGKVLGLDSYFALIVPGLFSAYGTFMLRQFFLSIPRDLEDAAFIDGCSLFGVYRHVALPLSTPAMATLGIITFMGSWRNFIWPLVVTATPEMQTVFVMLSSFAGVTGTEWHLLMAGTLIVIAPMITVFLFGQRFFIEGIRLGGVKG